MENWKLEIKRLEVIRERLGLNFNQLEKLSGQNRQKISNMFKMVNEPSLGFYLTIKSTLENQIKVIKERKEIAPSEKEIAVLVENNCDCKMDGMLFIRGKSGCKKAKDEHKF